MALSLIFPKLLLLSVTFFVFGAYGVDPIITSGSKFFYKSSGIQFIVKGVVYKTPGFSSRKVGDLASFVDPLADDRICQQDVRHLVNLGINTLLITGFNADRDQRGCMKIFSDAGIYVLVMINGDSEITQQIKGSVGTPIGYTSTNHFFRAVDFFQKWNNTLGLAFFLQDFTRLSDHPAEILPLQKRYIGDIKDFIKSRDYRAIPIGVLGTEHAAKGFNIPQYMVCGDESLAADFYASWPRCFDLDHFCLNASAHYSDLRDTFHDYHRPLILAEGCRKGNTFGFEWIRELYSPIMTDIFSGAIFHDWIANPDEEGKSDENSNSDQHGAPPDLKNCPELMAEGLVSVSGTNVTLNQAYSALSRQFAMAEPTPGHLSTSSQGDSIPCRDLALKKGEFPAGVAEDVTIKPILPAKSSEKLCRCMMDTVTCVSNPDSSLGSHLDRMSILWNKCENLTSTSQPKYCYGTRIVSDAGLYDSFIHCNATEKLSWQYSQFSNSSEACGSLDGLVTTPTPTTYLPQNCQMLLQQAGVSGTGTVTNFPTDTMSVYTKERSRTIELSRGVKVVIGVVVSLLILLIIAGGYIIYRRANMMAFRKKGSEPAEYEKPELPDNTKSNVTFIELNNNEVHELEGSDIMIQEADSGSGRVEVIGDFGAGSFNRTTSYHHNTGAAELESPGHVALETDTDFKPYKWIVER